MFKKVSKKLIALIAICVLVLSTTVVYAATSQNSDLKAQKAASVKMTMDEMSDADLSKIANKMGINIDGLNRDQIIQKLQDMKQVSPKENDAKSIDQLSDEELAQIAAKMGLDVSGLSRGQIIQKMKDQKIAMAANGGSKPVEEITAEELAQTAAQVGIDTTGLSRDQIIQKLTDYKKGLAK